MTELEKCMAGKIYDCHNKTFLYLKEESRRLLREYNALKYEQKEEKREILNRLFGQIGTNVSVGQPFLCDYGVNISLGNNVSINMNCTFVDCNKIEMGAMFWFLPMCSYIRQPTQWNFQKGLPPIGTQNQGNTFAVLMPCLFKSETAAGWEAVLLCFLE